MNGPDQTNTNRLAELKIVLLNASIHGDSENSNTLEFLKRAKRDLVRRGLKASNVTLISPERMEFQFASGRIREQWVLDEEKVVEHIRNARGLVIGCGTHYAYNSTLQMFWEGAMPTENEPEWNNLPVVLIASEHSTGGQTLAGTLSTTVQSFGGIMAGWISISRVGQLANVLKVPYRDDIFRPSDIGALCDKLIPLALKRELTEVWPVDEDLEDTHANWARRLLRKVGRAIRSELH